MLCTSRAAGALILALILGGSVAGAQETGAEPAPADNTRINQRDRDKSQPTADQQKENRSDRELARQVRRALVKDKSLSTYGHNVKVISEAGMVTLKGPVRSEEEKQAIEAKAVEVAGQGKVSNQLQVAPGKQ